ncbi:MAG: MerR family transcriptional regulator [Bacillota bacterium]|jgi:DNA-binding transcriptional MerR regulator
MRHKIYSTKTIAKLCGVHPNTVRLYEQWGYIAKAKRGRNNYRKFTEAHLRQMQLARIALPGPYPIANSIVRNLVKTYAAGDLQGSLQLAETYLAKVKAEKVKALQAMEILDKWHADRPGNKEVIVFETRKQVAAAFGLSSDALRTWERNGLYHLSQKVHGKLQFSEWDLEKLMVIRLLRNCGYSIASLLNVFANEATLMAKPSQLLPLQKNDAEISYITDRYLEFLEEHIARAGKILDFLHQLIT